MARKTSKIPEKVPLNKGKQKKKQNKRKNKRNKRESVRPMVERERYLSPFEMMRQFDREMDNFWRSVENRFLQPRWWREHDLYGYTAVRQPLLDVEDSGKNIIVTAEMPGIPKKNIDIKVKKDYIEISAKAGRDKEEKGKDYYHRERSFHSFYRQLPLPTEVDQTKADAELKDGILKVKLPKKESRLKQKSQKIFIK